MILAMRIPTGLVRFTNACACLSRTTQVLYSFCSTVVWSRACTPPWQLGELQDPGPVYFDGSVLSAAGRLKQASEHAQTTIPKHRPFFMFCGAST